MWAFLLRGGRPCFRHRASLSCGWAILVPRNALLLGADSCHLCRWWQASGASLAGWRGLPSLPHPPGLWQAQQEERGACGIGGWRAGSSASPGSSFCPTEASCSGRDKGPFLIAEQTTEQAFSSRRRGRTAQGLCWTDGHLPAAAVRSSSNAQVIGSGLFQKLVIVLFSPCIIRSVSEH